MRKKRLCAALLSLALLASTIPAATAAGTVTNQVPPMPNVTKHMSDGWYATWYRMETGLQVGDYMYSYDPDPSSTMGGSDYNQGIAADAYQITSMPNEFKGADFFITRPNRNEKLVFDAEQAVTIYAAIDDAYSSDPSCVSGWTATNYTMKIKDGTTYHVRSKNFNAGTINLGTGGTTNNNKNIFYVILPQNGETVYNATQTGNALVAEGTAPAKNAADEEYQYYLNDVVNLHTVGNVPADYEGENASVVLVENIFSAAAPATEKTVAAGENMALNMSYSANGTSYEGSPIDGDDQTYWQGPANGDGSFGNLTTPNVLTVDLGGQAKISSVVLKARNKTSWADRTQNIKLEYSTDGVNYTTLVAAKDYLFTMTTNNVLDTITFNEVTGRFVRATIYSNTQAHAAQIAEFEVYGPAQTYALEGKGLADGVTITDKAFAITKADKFVYDDAYVTKTFSDEVSGKVIFEGKVLSNEPNQYMEIPVMADASGKEAVKLYFDEDGHIKAASADGVVDICTYTEDTWYTLKMLIDTDADEYEVWVDHIRKAQNVSFVNDVDSIASMTFGVGIESAGSLYVDNLRLYDNPEVFAVYDKFNDARTNSTPSNGWTFSGSATVAEVPFASDKSVNLNGQGATATRTFDPITGDVTVEVKVKPMNENWVTMPMITDASGKVAAKVAFYQKSFFIANGDNWEYVCDQEIPNNYYIPETWFYIKLVMNTYTNRYDFYVDGALRYSAASFVEDVDSVSKIVLKNEQNNQMYIDDVIVYDSASLARGLYPQEHVFNVRDFGAKGDGVTDDTKAVESAILAAAGTGGTVLFENGTFYVGQIIPLSDMSIFIDTSATLLFKYDRDVYKHIVASNGHNGNNQLGCGLFLTEDGTQNVRIEGGGTIDGDGLYAFNQNDPKPQRPCTMYLTLSRDLYIQNLNVYNAQHWTLVPYESTNLTFRNINICNHIAPNRDGIDPTNCSNMTTENCKIIAGDDAFCPKSGNLVPSYNLDTRNCMLTSYCNGIKHGTDAQGPFKNYNYEDIYVKSVGMSAITLQAVDGSEIQNISFERIDIIDTVSSVNLMVGNRMRTASGETRHLGFVRDIYFNDISFQNAMRGTYNHKDNRNRPEILIYGLSDEKNTLNDGLDHSVSNVYFSNLFFEGIGGYTSAPGYDDGIGGGYPEYDGLGESVGYGATIRWANNVNFDDTCVFVNERADSRVKLAYASEYSANAYHEPLFGFYVVGVADKVVDINTAKDDIGLPTTVTVLREDNKIVEVPVASWDGTYDRAKAGAYELTATLGTSDELTNEEALNITTTVYVVDEGTYGDITGDEIANINDLVTLKDWILAEGEPSYEQLKKGDFNGNGKLDVGDILLLKSIILKRV